MKSSFFVSYALSISAAAVSLAACGGSQPPINTDVSRIQSQSASAFRSQASKQGYRVLYSFGLPPDGSVPEAGLIYVDGTLYGTTSEGGEYYTGLGTSDGTVFTLTTKGKERVLYSFRGGSDGAFPMAPLLNENGTLYGTTYGGGGNYCITPDGCGTVFSITKDGTEKVLHSFSGPDGANPQAGLIDVNGVLYGTTSSGGTNTCKNYDGCGTVFSITKDGTEKVLHSFGAKKDGAFPEAGLIEVNGTLYGTTSRGGEYDKQKTPYEGGVVFSVTTGGTEKVLHNFGNRADGAAPEAGLIDVNGTLYGTTRYGGAYYNCGVNSRACGTLFSITTAGKEKVLNSFASYQTDGCHPVATLLDVKGTLYGTASLCGAYRISENGNGTVFSSTTGGTVTALHSFSGGPGGWHPEASLIDVNGTLYGTTIGGGDGYGSYGLGTVFALAP
jgi:uncharacterized repeat protein (TIGR03803 family)